MHISNLASSAPKIASGISMKINQSCITSNIDICGTKPETPHITSNIDLEILASPWKWPYSLLRSSKCDNYEQKLKEKSQVRYCKKNKKN